MTKSISYILAVCLLKNPLPRDIFVLDQVSCPRNIKTKDKIIFFVVIDIVLNIISAKTRHVKFTYIDIFFIEKRSKL